MSVHIRRKRGRLYLDIYHDGWRRWESLHLSLGKDKLANAQTMRTADIIRQKRELQIVSSEWGLVDPSKGKDTVIHYASELASKQPVKNHLPKSLKYLEEYARGTRLGSITEKWLDGYLAFLLEKGLSKATTAHYFAALKMVLKRAVRDLVIPRNPADGVANIAIPETVKIHLTPREIHRLAAAPIGGALGAECKKAFLFATLTGLRISDLRDLTWGQIERDPLQVAKRQEKTGRVVTIPLNAAAWRIIDERSIHPRTDKVFPLLTSSKANTNQYLVPWARRAGVDKPIGWHTARHTFAVLALEGGADFFTVSKLLGHTKTATTAVYAKATDSLKRTAVEGLPDIKLPKVSES